MNCRLVTGYFTWNIVSWLGIFLFTLFVVVCIERKLLIVRSTLKKKNVGALDSLARRYRYERFPIDMSVMVGKYMELWFRSEYLEIFILIFLSLLFLTAVFM